MSSQVHQVLYKGIKFPRKIEARWAAFFDLCGHRWEHWERKFGDWTPTFVLLGRTGEIFVQVSQHYESDPLAWQFQQDHMEWLSEITTPGRKLYLRSGLYPADEGDCLTSGWVEESYPASPGKSSFEPMCWSYDHDGKPDFHPFYGSWTLLLSNLYEGDSFAFRTGPDPDTIQALWERAGAAIQSSVSATGFKPKRVPISPQVRYIVLEKAGRRCAVCGTTSSRARLEVDHINPVARGGTNDLENLQALCVTCNQGKGKSVVTSDSELSTPSH
jgi:5-methylcytosine-specific restriction protein A